MNAEETYICERRKAWRYLGKGTIFLICCIAIGETAHTLNIPLAQFISESLLIPGWVALWKPIEMFLYELPELRKDMRT